MPSSRRCIVVTLIAVVIIVAAGVGIYFATKSSSSSNKEPTSQSNSTEVSSTTPAVITTTPASNNNPLRFGENLLVKYSNGVIKLFDLNSTIITNTVTEEIPFGITAFGIHLDKTVYYATGEENSPIYSSSDEFSKLANFTTEWTKTAIAVDDVTEKVYVVDGLASQIKVVDFHGKYNYILPLKLNNPKDVILIPKDGTMFVIQDQSIIYAQMNGEEKWLFHTHMPIEAVTLKTESKTLYVSHAEGITSYSRFGNNNRSIVKAKNIKSLAYKNNTLYFITESENSSNKKTTKLNMCRLDDPNSILGECGEPLMIHEDEQLDQVKVVSTKLPQRKNPCDNKNSGCEQLCLLSGNNPKGYECACSFGFKLNPNEKSCDENPVSNITTSPPTVSTTYRA